MAAQLTSACSIAECLQQLAAHHGKATAFRWVQAGSDDQEITWQHLHAHAVDIAAAIKEHTDSGSRVILCLPQGLDFIAALFACFYAQCTAVPVYPPESAKSLPRFRHIVSDSEAALVITTASLARKMATFFNPETIDLPLLYLDKVARGSAMEITLPPAGQLALLQYTSGTTSDPRGVMLSHQHIMNNEQAIQLAYRLGDKPHMVSWLPFYHDMGLMGGVFGPVYNAISATLMSPTTFLRNPSIWLQTISDRQATITAGPNFAYDLCTRRIPDATIDQLNLSCLHTAICGAEVIRPETVDTFLSRFARTGFRSTSFVASYGLAEATLYVTSSRYQEPLFDVPPGGKHPVISCGSPPVGSIRIVDPDTCQPLPDQTVGEIWVDTPSVSDGYWGKPELSQPCFRAALKGESEGRFLRTGDLGMWKHGQLFVTGRLKELIIVRGRNYAPQDIESAALKANAAFAGMQCAAFSVDTPAGEQLVVVQEVSRRLQNNQSPEHMAADIRMALRSVAAVEADHIILVRQHSLPRTSSGKLQRIQVKSLYTDNALHYLPEQKHVTALNE